MRAHPLLLAILAVLPGCDEVIAATGCQITEEGTTSCPEPGSVSADDLSIENQCGDNIEVLQIKGQGELRSFPEGPVTFCCYPVDIVNPEPEPCPTPVKLD